MNTTRKTYPLFALPLLLSLQLAACDKPQSAEENRNEVTKQRVEGIKEIGNAVIDQQADAAAMGANSPDGRLSTKDIKKDAENVYQVDKEMAEANYAVATTRCETSTDAMKTACVSRAKADYDTAIATADANREMAKNFAESTKTP